MAKRFVRPERVKKRSNFDEIKLRGEKKIPHHITCKICHKKEVKIEDAVFQEGGMMMGHKSFWLCAKHVSSQPFAKV